MSRAHTHEEAFLENIPLVRATGTTSRFTVRDTEIGGPIPVVIAGPCAVESEEQIMTIAERIKTQGCQGLRGGVFKPRSSPYSFQGLGEVGLKYLARARERTGLFTVVEVTAPDQLKMVAEYADILQVGARNMQNFELLKAVGRSSKPVLLKRGLSATVQEFLQAAEYILCEGNSQVILCERGIRTFETMTRNTLDINAIPLLQQLTHLPVFADPSHGTGRRDLVIPVAKAALSAGAVGLIIEVHPHPEAALSDGNQSLDFQEFGSLMLQLGNAKPFPINVSPGEVRPGPDCFRSLAHSGTCRYIPVQLSLTTDTETPVTAFAKLTSGPGRFLLESVERGEQVGRFSFIGWEPLLTFQAKDTKVTVTRDNQSECYEAADPLAELKLHMDALKATRDWDGATPKNPGFDGGAVGFLGYDYVRRIENLPDGSKTGSNDPDLLWMVPKYLAAFDHVTHQISLTVLAAADPIRPDSAYRKACGDLQNMLSRLQRPSDLEPLSIPEATAAAELSYSVSQAEFEAQVRRVQEYIKAGDAFQVVLSQRITQPFKGDPFRFYRRLRAINPSPYLFYLDFGSCKLAGSSPEVMVKLQGDQVTLKPIAGTRPRGADGDEDLRLARELLADEKERAEHIMLVDLGRNDLGRVCRFGTVSVEPERLMNIETYSHVMHMVSTIHGRMLPEYSGVDLLRAVFPAGTLSGAPKIRAMEIIDELEPLRRGVYGGAVGYMGFNGNLDTCITIRTVLFEDGYAQIQAGAGIVADSIPEREYRESLHKAGALLKALALSGGCE